MNFSKNVNLQVSTLPHLIYIIPTLIKNFLVLTSITILQKRHIEINTSKKKKGM